MNENILLYYWPTPNGWKITIALEEMDLPYEIRLVNLAEGEQFSEEFRSSNRVPSSSTWPARVASFTARPKGSALRWMNG
jgi:hypothetical protein